MMSKDPPPTSLIRSFGDYWLCKAQIEFIERFQPSYYQFGSTIACARSL